MVEKYIKKYTKAQRAFLAFFSSSNDETEEAMRAIKMNPRIFSYDFQKVIKKFNAHEPFFELLGNMFFDETQAQTYKIVDLARDTQIDEMIRGYKAVAMEAYNEGKIDETELIQELQKDAQKKVINLLTVDDILNSEADFDFLVEDPGKEDSGLFPQIGVSGIVAEPGSYKTFICLDLCFKISQGKDWLLKYPTKKSNCLFIDEENNKKRLNKRINALLTSRDHTVPKNLYFMCFSGINFLDPTWIKTLEETIITNNIRFIVIDSFVDVFNGDENSVQDVQPVMHTIRTLATKTESHFLLIHHTNKSDKNKKYRGSSAFNGALDLLLQLERTNGPEEKNPELKLYTAKARDIEHFEKHIELIFNPGNNLGIAEKF